MSGADTFSNILLEHLDSLDLLDSFGHVSEPAGKLLALVDSWTSKIDLVAPASPEEQVERHALDSILAFTHLQAMHPFSSCIDVGSGAGFPGLVFAICDPKIRVILCEPREKRASFLREAARKLGISNVEVCQSKVENLEGVQAVECLISRALGRPELLMEAASFILLKEGVLAEMVGPNWRLPELLSSSFPEFRFAGRLAYTLPKGSERAVAVWNYMPEENTQ